MKKAAVVLFLFICLLPLLAGGRKESGEERIVLSFVEVMTSPERTLLLNRIIEKYESEHPGIDIELISLPYGEGEEKLGAMLREGVCVDIAEIQDNSYSSYVSASLLSDLSSYVDGWDTEEILPVALMAARSVGGRPYVIPQYLYVKGLMVRNDILGKYGIPMPRTTDEFLEACKTLSTVAEGQYGFALRGTGWPCKTTDIMMITEVADIDPENLYFTKDGSFYLDTDGGRRATEKYLELYRTACPPSSVTWGFSEQIRGFISGTTPFLVQDSDAVGSIRDALREDQYTVIPMPLGESGTRYLDYGFAGLSIPVTARHPDEAWDFIRYMMSAEVEAAVCELYGALPVNRRTYTISPVFSKGIYAAWAEEMTDENTLFVSFPLSDPRFNDYVSFHAGAMESMLLGETGIEETIALLRDFWIPRT